MRIFILFMLFCLIQKNTLSQNLAKAADNSKKPSNEQELSETDYVILQKIFIEGNDRTRSRIILRELDISEGDTLRLAKVDTILFRNKNKIFNTNLFVTVELSLEKTEQNYSNLKIKLQERWYFFPLPLFELSDRNFNEWWNTYNADLSRVNFGIRLIKENFRGRNEKLDLLAQFGFTKQFGLDYKIPYFDRKQKHGLNVGFSYAQNKTIAYRTFDHKLDFIDSNKVLREKFEARLALTKRNAFYSFHQWEIKFHYNSIADTVARLNPLYFLEGKTLQRYFLLGYRFRIDLRDIAVYPLRGSFFQLILEKQGLGIFKDIDMTTLNLSYAKYRELGKGFFLENQLKGQYVLQQRQPYFNSRALGYNSDFLRAYELYVIDGQAYGISKNTLRFRLFDTKRTFNFIPIRQFRTVPVAAYLTAFFDAAYVKDKYFTAESTRFANRFIYGTGLGIDTVTFYNLVITVNYAMNTSLERGFFINFKTDL